MNKRIVAKQTEDGLGPASDFWKDELSAGVAGIAKSTGKPYKADATTIVHSVNGRTERDITKWFEGLYIDWPVSKSKLQAWKIPAPYREEAESQCYVQLHREQYDGLHCWTGGYRFPTYRAECSARCEANGDWRTGMRGGMSISLCNFRDCLATVDRISGRILTGRSIKSSWAITREASSIFTAQSTVELSAADGHNALIVLGIFKIMYLDSLVSEPQKPIFLDSQLASTSPFLHDCMLAPITSCANKC